MTELYFAVHTNPPLGDKELFLAYFFISFFPISDSFCLHTKDNELFEKKLSDHMDYSNYEFY